MIKFNKEKIEYSDYYVAFLDVLGFKQLVLSNNAIAKFKIESYFGLINHVTHGLQAIKAKQRLESIIISDSVILSMPVGKLLADKIDNLRQLCVAAGIIQYILAATMNVWLRGAISYGKAYLNKQQGAIVGPAYIYAHLLEGQAIFPRVIIDNRIIKFLKKKSAQDLIDEINKKDKDGLNYDNWLGNILFDWEYLPKSQSYLKQDAAIFLDYMSQSFGLEDKEDLVKIIDYIRRNIYSDNNIYGKFRWVVNYLLVSCETLINNGRHDLKDYFSILKRY